MSPLDPKEARRSGRESLSPETRLLLIENSLADGAKKFTTLEMSLEAAQEAAKPKPVKLWPFITFGFIVLNAIIALVWFVSDYPKRAEYERDRAVHEDRYERMRQELAEAKTNLVRQQVTIDALEKRIGVAEGTVNAAVQIAAGRRGK